MSMSSSARKASLPSSLFLQLILFSTFAIVLFLTVASKKIAETTRARDDLLTTPHVAVGIMSPSDFRRQQHQQTIMTETKGLTSKTGVILQGKQNEASSSSSIRGVHVRRLGAEHQTPNNNPKAVADASGGEEGKGNNVTSSSSPLMASATTTAIIASIQDHEGGEATNTTNDKGPKTIALQSGVSASFRSFVVPAVAHATLPPQPPPQPPKQQQQQPPPPLPPPPPQQQPQKTLPKEEEQQQSRSEFPQVSMTENFFNAATKEETRKHDRLIVHSMIFMRQLLNQRNYDVTSWSQNKSLFETASTQAAMAYWSPHPNNTAPISRQQQMPNNKRTRRRKKRQQVCVVIFTSLRTIPYIDALLTVLMEGNPPRELDETLQIHLVNAENRQPYPYFDQLAQQLPLIHQAHSNTAYSHEAAQRQRQEDPSKEFYVLQKDMFLKGLEICQESGLDYCLLMEDDALPTKHFCRLLKRIVLQPLNRPRQLKNIDPPVSLFNYRSHPWAGKYRVDTDLFIKSGMYNLVRSKSNAERRSRSLPSHQEEMRFYKVSPFSVNFGAVAELYSKRRARELHTFLKDVMQKWWTQWNATATESNNTSMENSLPPSSPIYNRNLDLLINQDFLRHIGPIHRHTVWPSSLVNHIGFYSELGQSFNPPLFTDVGFTLDAGIYNHKKAREMVRAFNVR